MRTFWMRPCAGAQMLRTEYLVATGLIQIELLSLISKSKDSVHLETPTSHIKNFTAAN
jgi:hypothetical protein